jgi:hypothetical protein
LTLLSPATAVTTLLRLASLKLQILLQAYHDKKMMMTREFKYNL